MCGKTKPSGAPKFSSATQRIKHVIREIVNSFFTIIIFGLVIMSVIYASKAGLTRIYPNISDRGTGYYIFSIVLMIIDARYLFLLDTPRHALEATV
jgi:lathosterol oxidase